MRVDHPDWLLLGRREAGNPCSRIGSQRQLIRDHLLEEPMSQLSVSRCVPCQGNEPPLNQAQIAELRPEVPDWSLVEEEGVKRLERLFRFRNYADSVAFTNQVAEIANAQDHHPLIVLEWGKVKVQWWTHKIKGLHRNDFIMAAKTDDLWAKSG